MLLFAFEKPVQNKQHQLHELCPETGQAWRSFTYCYAYFEQQDGALFPSLERAQAKKRGASMPPCRFCVR
jgi:hypothetical protein